MIISHIVGTLGSVLIIFGYFMTIEGKWKPTNKQYLWCNLCAALLLMYSLMHNFNLGSMIIEIFWVLITLRGLINKSLKRIT